MAYNPEMEKLKELQLLTQQIAGQYGGGNDAQSVGRQNNAAVQAMRAQGMTDAQIAQELPSLPWNDQSRAIPAQMPAPAAAPQMPVQAPVAAPAPMPAPAQAQQAKPSFFQRMGQRFDQAATGGVIDPTTLTKDQRRMLRGQLLMNVGGALSQNRPIGEGFQQQYNALTKQKAEQQALQARKAVAEAFSGGVGNREQFMAAVQNLLGNGQFDVAMDLLSKGKELFPQQKYSTDARNFVDIKTGKTFLGVVGDNGEIKTIDGVTLKEKQRYYMIPEGGKLVEVPDGPFGASGDVTTVIDRPKTPKLRRQANIPGYDKPVYEGEDGQFYEWVDE